jgi:uncharacterized protein YceK
MKFKITILLISLLICGCSSAVDTVAPDESPVSNDYIRLPQDSRWNWHTGLYRVSADHTTIEKLPNRTADWHVNVNVFVEPPNCNQCLMIGKPQIQPDGTIKVKVILTHPFPGQPQYTGFDVKGTIMFPATQYWETKQISFLIGPPEDAKPIWSDYTRLYFSRAEDGGGELLNADGYTLYLFPGLDLPPYLPISRYSKGKRANGPDPDSTINGFKLFTKDPGRRMFRVSDTISRTYHISPPQGEFIFGYVVDASWVPPTNTPVTDPANDFPFWANCEEGYVLEFKQIAPFKTGTYQPYWTGDFEYVTNLKYLTYPDLPTLNIPCLVFCPDIIPDPDKKEWPVMTGLGYNIHIESPGTYVFEQYIEKGTYDAPPGQYLALLVGHGNYCTHPENTFPMQLIQPPFFDFIYLDVVQGD